MKKKKHNSMFFLMLLFFLLCVSVVVSISVFTIYSGKMNEHTDKKVYDKYFVMITDNRKSSFWQSVYKGMYEKGLENNIYVELLGEDLTKDYSREELMEIAIASDVDGIIVEADESERMTELIQEANASSIAVVTVYGDNTKSDRCSFVGIGSYNLGREYGSQVLEIANGRNKVNATVLVSANKMDSGQNIMCSGIRDTLEKESEASIELTLVTVDDSNMFSTEESIRNMLMREKHPDIIICLDELNTVRTYQAVVDYNMVGQVSILGYYDSDTIIRAIDRNVIYATISVDTKQMGEYCIEALYDYLTSGITSQYYMADVTLVNKDNVADYMGGDNENEN